MPDPVADVADVAEREHIVCAFLIGKPNRRGVQEPAAMIKR